MKSVLYLLFLAALIQYSLSDSCDVTLSDEADADSCLTREVDENHVICCYVESESGDGTTYSCKSLTPLEYGDITNFADKQDELVDDYDIDCNSSFLTVTLLGLLFLLF